MAPEKTGAAQKILPLTSLRFLAAFYVLLFHLSRQVAWLNPPNFFGRFISLGYTAVSFFFVLSGFVLALAYLQSAGPVDTRRFLIARFARIYPALFSCLVLDLPHFLYIEIRVQHESLLHILTGIAISFTALEAWFPHIPGIDGPSWSISVEFLFYLMFPLLAPPLWRLRARLFWPAAAGLYLAGNLLIFVIYRTYGDSFALSYQPFGHLAEFLLGICTAHLYLIHAKSPCWSAITRRLSPVAALLAASSFLAIPVFSLEIPVPYLQHGLLVPIYSVLILAFASGSPVIAKLFSRNGFVILGEASFALYLIHMPLLMLLRRPMQTHPYVTPPAFALIAIALSVASFYYLETPARHWILTRLHSQSREDLPTQAVAQ